MGSGNLTVWLSAARPKTLPAAIAPVIIGTSMATYEGGFHLFSALAAMLGAVLIQIGTNFANDYYDFKRGSDRKDRLGPTRATTAGLVSPNAMKKATILAFSCAFLIGIYLVLRGGLPIVIIGLLSILFGVLYTGGPKPIGYIGLGDLFVLIFFGPIAVGGTYFVQTLEINQTVILAGLAPGLFSVAILTVNNLRDIESDRISGKKTLAVRFGITFSKYEYLLSVIVGSMIPLYLYLLSGEHPYSMFGCLVLILAIPSIKTIYTSSGEILNKTLASTGMILFLYSLNFSIGWLL
jgi:1,4-dihydroxy-2-naphthoate octaprenyltransferase